MGCVPKIPVEATGGTFGLLRETPRRSGRWQEGDKRWTPCPRGAGGGTAPTAGCLWGRGVRPQKAKCPQPGKRPHAASRHPEVVQAPLSQGTKAGKRRRITTQKGSKYPQREVPGAGIPVPSPWGGSGGEDGCSVWFPSASVPFESPRGCGGGKMSPAGWWGRGRERKIPIKGGHCLEPGMGLGRGEPAARPSPPPPRCPNEGAALSPPTPCGRRC